MKNYLIGIKMRKLATIRRIDELVPIEGSDLVQIARIDGWQCVVKKSEFNVGDLCVYFEIDSHLPIRPEFEHLRKNSFKKMGEREGFRIKTIKLRGELSQGLALPLSILGEAHEIFTIGEGCIGADVTADLDVQKYEPPIPAELAGRVSGNFPGFIPKTEQIRCQNHKHDIFVKNADTKYEVTMKMDGTSFTGYSNVDKTGVCGRNWELDINEENKNNTLVRMFIDSGLQTALNNLGRNIAVQGELMGPGIQKNREGFLEHKLFVFDIYDIDAKKYLGSDDRLQVLDALYGNGLAQGKVQHVPIFSKNNTIAQLGINSVGELLKDAEGPSFKHPIREGKVYKSMDGTFSFKAISNQYLLKSED